MVGISFKIAKTGIKYSPSIKKRPIPSSLDSAAKPPEVNQPKRRRAEVALPKINADHNSHSLLSTTSKGSPTTSEHEASFAVNLFLDGFSVGKPTEQGKQAPSAQELIRSLHPYNRTSETLFQAINDGWLPGDILEEIPCKYVNGSVMCEVRDYRKGSPTSGDSVTSGEGYPVVHKVLLRPTMENIVKDISSMAESWAYSDLMEIESRILKAVQPKICLDPAPMLERLCENSNSNKLNLGLPLSRRERKQKGRFPLVKVISNNLSHDKKVPIEGNIEKAMVQTRIPGATSAFEGSSISCGQENSAPPTADISSSIATQPRIQIESRQDLSRLGVQGPSNSLTMQSGLNRSRILPALGNLSPPVTSTSLASASMLDWTNTVDTRNMYVPMLSKRERDLAPANKADLKKPKQEQVFMDKFQQQNAGPNFDTKPTRDQQRKDMPMQQNQNNESMYISDMSVHRPSQQVTPDDGQLVTGGAVSAQDPKLSSNMDPRSAAVFKVKEEHLEFERGQIGIDRESQGFGRSNDTQHLMEVDNNLSGLTQISSQCFPQQPYSKPSFQWQPPLGQAGEKDQKRDEPLMKRKLVQSPRDIGGVGRRVLQSPPLTKLGELSPLISTTVTSTSLGPCNNMAASVGQQKEKSLGVSTVSNAATSASSIQIDSQHPQAQQSMSFSRHKSTSLSKQPSASGVASPGSVTNSMVPSNVNSPSTGTAPLPSSITKPDQSSVSQDQSKQLENISTLVSVIQKHGLPIRKKSVEEVRETAKVPPSCQFIAAALNNATNDEDQIDVKGQRSLSNSVVGGGVNVRKTRIMNFVHSDHMYPGNNVLVRRFRVRLVMCERAKDGMVEAVVQFGDDQDEDSLNCCPHDVLPSLPNTHCADRLAVQFNTLMEKDGYELIEDQVQPIQQRQQMLPPNASSTTQSMTPGNNMNQLPSSPHVMASQNMVGSAAVCGMPPLSSLPLSSPNALAAVRMPPPGNAPSRQLSSSFLQSGLGTSKSLQLDPASELVAVQQQHQQHQIQQQHQLQQHPQQQLQRSQQLVNPNHLAQLNSASFNSSQQMNSKFMNSAQMKMQMLQKHHQHQQQLQRKGFLQGGMGSNIGNIGVGNISVNSMSGVGMPVSGHNMVGLGGGMSMGMQGVNNISASMGVMPNLTNINTLSGVGGMGQNPGIGNMLEHQIRAGNMNTQTTWDRVRMGPGRGRPGAMVNPSLRSIENMPGLAVSNQGHGSVNLAIHGPQQGRNNMSSLQNRGMNPPKPSGMHGVTGQSFYLNQQLNNQSQQINSQQLNQQQQLNVQQQLNMAQPPSSQQPLSSQPLLNVQHQLSQQISSQQQINSQSQLNSQQQLNAQQLNSQPQLNPQQMNASNLGSLALGPSSPPLSSQTLGSVGSITSSPMELQSANRGNPMTSGQ